MTDSLGQRHRLRWTLADAVERRNLAMRAWERSHHNDGHLVSLAAGGGGMLLLIGLGIIEDLAKVQLLHALYRLLFGTALGVAVTLAYRRLGHGLKQSDAEDIAAAGRCPVCWYDLSTAPDGNGSTVCPECAAAWGASDPARP